MKILLVIFENVEALGLRLLHAIISENYECKMLFVQEYNDDLILKCISDYKPDVVGFSLVSVNWDYYKNLYPKLKNLENFKIILGGWHVTLQPEQCQPYCDVVCKGEGENIIKQIIQDIDINNFQKEYIGNYCSNLDNLPFPILHENYWSYIVENNKLEQRDPLFTNYRYGITIGRGCAHSCSYCSNSFMKNIYPQWNKIRYRNYDLILQELILAKTKIFSLDTIVFFDEIFLPPIKGRTIFLRRYKEEIDLPFYALFYPGTCSNDFAKELKMAGMGGVWLGIQSGSERVRKEVFNRYYTNKKILEQAEIFYNNNIKVRYDFIFDNPFETEEDFMKTIGLIKQLPRPNTINIFKMKYFPNTKLTNLVISLGITNEEDIWKRLKTEWCKTFSSNEIDCFLEDYLAERGKDNWK